MPPSSLFRSECTTDSPGWTHSTEQWNALHGFFSFFRACISADSVPQTPQSSLGSSCCLQPSAKSKSGCYLKLLPPVPGSSNKLEVGQSTGHIVHQEALYVDSGHGGVSGLMSRRLCSEHLYRCTARQSRLDKLGCWQASAVPRVQWISSKTNARLWPASARQRHRAMLLSPASALFAASADGIFSRRLSEQSEPSPPLVPSQQWTSGFSSLEIGMLEPSSIHELAVDMGHTLQWAGPEALPSGASVLDPSSCGD